jgi:hypothetical protein
MLELANAVFSLMLGIVASFIAWLIVSKAMVPQIEISEKIFCTKSLAYDGTTMFKIEITNTSKRDAYEISLLGRLILYGLDKKNPSKAFYYIALVGTGRHPYIPGNRGHNNRRFLVKPTKECKEQMRKLYGLKDEKTTLEGILEANEQNRLEITVISSHGYSGARKARSQIYSAVDIELIDDLKSDYIGQIDSDI